MRGRHHQHEARIAVIDHKGLQFLLLGGQVDAMVEIAGNHVGAAAEHGLERIRATLQIDQLNGKTRLLELAKLLCQHGGQIAQAGAAADGDGNLALRCRKIGHHHECQNRRGNPAKNPLHHFLRAFDWPHDKPACVS